MASGASYTLETKLQWKLAPIFLLIFYNNIKIRSSAGLSSVSQGGISFSVFSNGVFSKISNGVSVKRMGFQWGWLKVNGVVLKVNGVNFRWGCYRG